jgi:hypothetical protein
MKQIGTLFTQNVGDIIADHNNKGIEQSKGNESETSRQRAKECFEKICRGGVKPSEFIFAMAGGKSSTEDDKFDTVNIIIGIDFAKGSDFTSTTNIVSENYIYRALGYSDSGRN